MTFWFINSLFASEEEKREAEAARERKRAEKLRRRRIAEKKRQRELDKLRDPPALGAADNGADPKAKDHQPGSSKGVVGSALDLGFGLGRGAGDCAQSRTPAPLPAGAQCPGILSESDRQQPATATSQSKINRPFPF